MNSNIDLPDPLAATKSDCPRVIVGVTGGIAAYKSAILVRRLTEYGCAVQVVMTQGAQAFVSPLTFQALSGNPVHTTLLDSQAEAGMGHIALARWADLVVIAPASANTLARLAAGMADDLLATLVLATVAPVWLAPAMNQHMWANAVVQANVATLEQFNFKVIAPQSGEQACGDVGVGRMPEPEPLAQQVRDFFNQRKQARQGTAPEQQEQVVQPPAAPAASGLAAVCPSAARETAAFSGNGPLSGKNVIITAGPTREAIDPVRYISNHSSGKMGFALAIACQAAGAQVTLIAGPVNLPTPVGIKRVNISSAQQLLDACQAGVDAGCDIFIATAAVADYRSGEVADHKIKKSADQLTLHLVKNPDIVASIARRSDAPFMVGFAAETQNMEDYAHQKLVGKRLDMVAVNDVSRSDIGFGSDDNAMTLFFADQYRLPKQVLPKASKAQIATQLVASIARALAQLEREGL